MVGPEVFGQWSHIDSNFISVSEVESEFSSGWQNRYGIGHGNNNRITNNSIINTENGIYVDGCTDNIIKKNNILSVRHWGISAANANGIHKYLNNNITKTHSEWFIYATNMENVIIDSNEFIGLGTDNNNRGIYVNNSGAEVIHNTLVTPGRGIHIENQAGSIIGNI